MHKTVVLNVVGMTPDLLRCAPALSRLAEANSFRTITSVLPAVTCTAQATYYTGVAPAMHGIVGNGWYFRDECEIKFWRQSNHLVQAPKVWEIARAKDPSFTCANLFGWYNMYSSVDYSVTPRPMYPADGRKIPDIYTQPAVLRKELQDQLGTFPLFQFWGPATSIRSSQWIADAALRVDLRWDPTLTLIYLPHLDYSLQKLGPSHPAVKKDVAEVDAVCEGLLKHYATRNTRVIVLSEYGITDVSRPIHINRILREGGYIATREELGRELLDAGASRAFAVSDHQIAHIYVNDPTALEEVRALLETTPGIEQVLDQDGKRKLGLDHARSGDLVCISEPDAWFTYYYWADDARAPDFARTVDIHRKPGYDPVELFVDPAIRFPKLKIAGRLAKKALGFRYLMDVIPLDSTLIKGSHGRRTETDAAGPLLISTAPHLLKPGKMTATEVCGTILDHLELP